MMNAIARTESVPLNADRIETGRVRAAGAMAVWQLNLLRVGYFVVGVCLAVVKWPLLLQDKTGGLAEGTVLCILVAMSVLALLGLRYPQRMLPILLFEVAWKLTWLAVVALPAALNDTLDDATRTQAASVLWVAIVIAVIPWRHVFRQYVLPPATRGVGATQAPASSRPRWRRVPRERARVSVRKCESHITRRISCALRKFGGLAYQFTG